MQWHEASYDAIVVVESQQFHFMAGSGSAHYMCRHGALAARIQKSPHEAGLCAEMEKSVYCRSQGVCSVPGKGGGRRN